MKMKSFWSRVNESGLRQGDYIHGCNLPIFTLPSALDQQSPDFTIDVEMKQKDLIILTQSCDLENKKVRFVTLCPLYALPDFEITTPGLLRKGEWEKVRQGRYEGLHLLGSPFDPEDNRGALVVDFREIHSLPIDYISSYAMELGDRWRLKSPFLEHFSQSFARSFMRVGLPSAIPKFN